MHWERMESERPGARSAMTGSDCHSNTASPCPSPPPLVARGGTTRDRRVGTPPVTSRKVSSHAASTRKRYPILAIPPVSQPYFPVQPTSANSNPHQRWEHSNNEEDTMVCYSSSMPMAALPADTQVKIVVPSQGLHFAHDILEMHKLSSAPRMLSRSQPKVAGGFKHSAASATPMSEHSRPSTAPASYLPRCAIGQRSVASCGPEYFLFSSHSQMENDQNGTHVSKPRKRPNALSNDHDAQQLGAPRKKQFSDGHVSVGSSFARAVEPSGGGAVPARYGTSQAFYSRTSGQAFGSADNSPTPVSPVWRWTASEIEQLIDLYEEHTLDVESSVSRPYRLWHEVSYKFACRRGMHPGTGPSAAQLQTKWKSLVAAARRRHTRAKPPQAVTHTPNKTGPKPLLDRKLQARLISLVGMNSDCWRMRERTLQAPTAALEKSMDHVENRSTASSPASSLHTSKSGTPSKEVDDTECGIEGAANNSHHQTSDSKSTASASSNLNSPIVSDGSLPSGIFGSPSQGAPKSDGMPHNANASAVSNGDVVITREDRLHICQTLAEIKQLLTSVLVSLATLTQQY